MDKEEIKLKSWASGFLNGEGCFAVAWKTSRAGQKKYCRPELQVQVRADDYQSLEALKKAFGCGSKIAYSKSQKASLTRGLSKPTVRVWWRNKEECLAVIKLIDEYPLRGKKDKDYQLWRKAVIIKHVDTRTYDEKNDDLMKLRIGCQDVKKYFGVTTLV